MLRDHIEQHLPGNYPRLAQIREYIEALCKQFVDSGRADPKFLKEIGSGSKQKFWACVSEAIVADRLSGCTFGSRERLGEGPDFLVLNGDRKIWIEVVCPQPTGLPADWSNSQQDTWVSLPHEQILLRWTSAIRAKAEALLGSEDGTKAGYLKSGLVHRDDAYVIAVNGCMLRRGDGDLPSLFGISRFPFAAEAVFPFGPVEVRLDRNSFEVLGQGHQVRPTIQKPNRSKVPTYTFLDKRFAPISAIWALDANGGAVIGNCDPMIVVHNPLATNPVPVGFLPAEADYVAVERGDHFELSAIRDGSEVDS
ncbi:MAG: hypothetical protein QM766_07085 [Burkholderiaceae bacterium]